MNPSTCTVERIRRFVHRLEDPEEFGHAVSGGCLEAEFLAPREAATQVEQFQSATWALDFHEARVKARIRCELPPGWGSVGLMRSPARSHWYGREVAQGVLVCTPPGEAIDGRIVPGFSCLSITVPVSVWEVAREIAGRRGSGFGGARVHLLEEPAYRRIEQRILALRGVLRAAAGDSLLAAEAAAEAAGFAVEILCLAWDSTLLPDPARDSLRNRARLARRAEEWMRAHLGEPIQIPDLCQVLRVSRRELEYAFRQVHGESPRGYLHLLRLNAIRRALHGDTGRKPVTQTALANGITHFGRLAADYRRLFGENPGDTRRGP